MFTGKCGFSMKYSNGLTWKDSNRKINKGRFSARYWNKFGVGWDKYTDITVNKGGFCQVVN